MNQLNLLLQCLWLLILGLLISKIVVIKQTETKPPLKIRNLYYVQADAFNHGCAIAKGGLTLRNDSAQVRN
jgi:hypothetical protein